MLVATRIAVLMPMLFLLAGIPLLAQDAAPAAVLVQQRAETPVTSFAFDVATIKPSDPDNRNFGVGFFGTRYNVINFSLSGIVFTAYFPYSKGNRVIGAPAWADKQDYDIVGHMDEATASSWLKLNRSQQAEAGHLMLQKLLAERCKLIVHTVPSQADGYALVVGKRGSRLQPAQHRDTYPDGAKDIGGDGGKVLPPNQSNNNTATFFNATINDLVRMIGGPYTVIVDRTNLTGRYDFTIHRLERPRDLDGKPLPDSVLSDLWDIGDTGIEIKPAKIPSENLVIDHIERPSPN
jgi:uncharacterized protein (TIGR03435 family)